MPVRQQLSYYANVIVDEGSFFIDVKDAIERLHSIFVNLGGIDANGQILSKGTYLPAGLAVSPVVAAKCAFDLARTRKFLQGIRAAIEELMQRHTSRPLQVLYAGSGPYALLALLTCPFYSAADIRFTVLDLHKQSIESASALIKGFELSEYFQELLVTDILEYKWEKAEKPDLIIAETLQSGLQNEQQVSITSHLAPQLSKEGIMIPQRIEVKAALLNTEVRQAAQLGLEPDESGGPKIIDVGTVIDLNRQTAMEAAENLEEPFKPLSFELPVAYLRPPYVLELQTIVTVFKEFVLKEFDSSITMPITIASADSLVNKKSISFNYVNKVKPRIEWQIT